VAGRFCGLGLGLSLAIAYYHKLPLVPAFVKPRHTAERLAMTGVSRILFPAPEGGTTTICLVRSTRGSPAATTRMAQDGTGRALAPARPCSGRGLPGGRGSRRRPVGSYPTFSPLPRRSRGAARRYVFCGTFLPTASGPWYPRLPRDFLPGGVRTFLPAPIMRATAAWMLSRSASRWVRGGRPPSLPTGPYCSGSWRKRKPPAVTKCECCQPKWTARLRPGLRRAHSTTRRGFPVLESGGRAAP